MAIINSAGIGKSRKSQGNLTYKYVRGRTIASSRITENKSNTPKQFLQRSRFAVFSALCQKLAFYIEKTYDKSKYGSARNAFMRINKSMLLPLDGLSLDDIRAESVAKTLLRLVDNLSDSTPHGLQFNSVGPIGANYVQSPTQPTGVTVLERCYGIGSIEVQGQWSLTPAPGMNNGYNATVWVAYTNSSGSAVLTTGELQEGEYNEDTNITTFAISQTSLESIISSADTDTHIFVWISLLCGDRIVQIARPIAFIKTA